MTKIAILSLMAHAALSISVGCQDVWSGPSAKNDLVGCLLARLRTSTFLGQLSATFIFVLLAVLLLLIYIPFFIIRQCCNGCGASVMRPGTCCYGGQDWDEKQEEAAKQYSRSSVICIRVFTVIMFILTFASVGLIISAALRVETTTTGLVTDVFGGVTSLIDNTVTTLKLSLQSNGTYIVPGVSDATFDVVGGISTTINSLRNLVNTLLIANLHIVRIVLIVISFISTVLALLTIFVMMCSVRRCLPATCTCCNFLFGFLFALLAALFFAVSVVLLFVEGEALLGAQQQPGMFQWYLVPACNGANPIPGLVNTATSALVDVSRTACNELLNSCDNNTAYNIATPQIAFVCNLTAATVNATCTNPSAVQALLSSSVAKAPVCDGCTVATCPTQCNDTSIANATRSAVTAVNTAVTVQAAVTRVVAFSSCNNLLLTLISGIRLKPAITFFFLISAGLAWSALTFMIFICINFKGQNLFLSETEMATECESMPNEPKNES